MTSRPALWLARAVALSAAALVLGARPARVAARRSPPPAAVLTGQARLDGFARHLEMKAASPFKDLKWQWLGPRNLSGRTTDIAAVQPHGANFTLYVGTASGGMWKTENEATRWEPVFEQAAATAIGAVAVAPSNQRIVWVGTGESNNYRSSQEGSGVYKSTDAGRTWQSMGLADTFTIGRIVVHPTNPDIVYVAAAGHTWTPNPERGVYKTTDGGRTWQKVLYVDADTGAIDVAMDPADPDTLYAATWQRTRLKWRNPRTYPGYTGSGIRKTTDGGRTWTDISQGLPAPDKRGRIGLSVCQTKPAVVYALVDDNGIARQPTAAERASTYGVPEAGIPRGATVYRSDDRGAHWTPVSGGTPDQRDLMAAMFSTFGFVFGQIRVDPNDADTVYVLGRWINVSHDGGRTFEAMVTPGGDYHGMWIDPGNSNYLVTASDTGIDISYDRGRTWKSALTGAAFPWAPDVGQQGLPVTQFYNVAYDMATPFHVYGSAQDNGSFRGVVDLGDGRDHIPSVEFDSAPGGEGSTHAIDPLDPNLVYTSGGFGRAKRVDLTKPQPPFSFTTIPTRYADEPPFRGQWLAPILLSPHSSRIVYQGLQYVLRSRDRADTWDVISPDLTRPTDAEAGDVPYHTIFTLAESPLRAGLLYAGTDDGQAHVTRDDGGSWTDITPGLAPGKWVSRVVASAFDLGTVYLTQNGKRDDDFTAYVWKSTDFGRTWASIAAGIPMGPVNVIREDPIDPNVLYVGTDTAVYVTTDRGATWNVLGGNLPAVYVHDLIIHPRDNIIVIATHGRGMWALDANPVNRKKHRPGS
jgi:photosystem II stability/assembly factor-like uncharacterized protein